MIDPQSVPDLDSLHPLYQPPPPSWMPQTPAWYLVFVFLALGFLFFVVKSIRHWLANRYRREALRELTDSSPLLFSSLLKRTALAAWPREQVASLSGERWLRFLNRTAKTDAFTTSPGNQIEDLALMNEAVSAEDRQQVEQIVADWIRRHRVQV